MGRTVEQVLEARHAVTARHALSLDAPRRAIEDPDETGIDVAVDEAGFAAAEDSAVLGDLMAILSERERLLLRLRFQEDRTQTQIGAIVGISQMHVSRLIRRALEQLQDAADSPH